MSVSLPVRRAEYCFLTCGGTRVATVLLDPEAGTLYARRLEDLADDAIALWIDELPAVAAELGAAQYLEILEDRLSNATGITDRERVFVRDFPAALDRLHARKVLGDPARTGTLPLYRHLPVAAHGFDKDVEEPEPEMLPDVPGIRPASGAYAARIDGRSMEPLIPDGAIAVFRPITGSRQGRRVLVRQRSTSESSGQYTIKVYRSEKRAMAAGWEHQSIILEPLNPEFEPIVLEEESDRYEVLGEFVMVLGIEDIL